MMLMKVSSCFISRWYWHLAVQRVVRIKVEIFLTLNSFYKFSLQMLFPIAVWKRSFCNMFPWLTIRYRNDTYTTTSCLKLSQNAVIKNWWILYSCSHRLSQIICMIESHATLVCTWPWFSSATYGLCWKQILLLSNTNVVSQGRCLWWHHVFFSSQFNRCRYKYITPGAPFTNVV